MIAVLVTGPIFVLTRFVTSIDYRYITVFLNFLGVHVLCFYVVIVILYVLLCCHVRRNKDTHKYSFNRPYEA